MEDPKYNRHWTINKLFESKEVQSKRYKVIFTVILKIIH